ncbi:hypothetical protein A2U01_0019519, partial [Trifolium medium]|nr:hypothetical protein [Trifolium medium]
MDGDQARPSSSGSNPQPDYSWIADEPRETVSLFVGCEGGHKDLFIEIQNPPTEDWEVQIPARGRRICSPWGWGTIPMYQIAFERLGYWMPFTDLEMAVFRHLHVSPSQLHPNSMVFLRAFEVTTSYLGISPTLKLFFHAFGLHRSCPKGEKAKGKAFKGVEKESTKHG